MGTAGALIIAYVVCAALLIGALLFALRTMRGLLSKSVDKDRDNITQQIQLHDTAIAAAVDRLTKLASLDDIRSLESRITELTNALAAEKANIEGMEERLKGAQSNVAEREGRQQAVKSGRADSQRLADELREKNAEMLAEYTRLESQIKDSRAQLATLEHEVSLNAEQKKAIDEISSSLEKSQDQLKTLGNARDQAAERFSSLEKQYADLEQEYKKLIEAENEPPA